MMIINPGFHLILTIIATQIVALMSNVSTVPYYPIEISRTIAGSPWSQLIFQFGIVSMIIYPFSAKSFSILFIWLALCIIAFLDDVNHWSFHMFGTLLLTLGSIYHIFITNTNLQTKYILMASVISLYLCRLMLKFLAVAFIELHISLTDFNIGQIPIVVDTAKKIMYDGSKDEVVLTIFKLTGVMQWMMFWLFFKAIF